MDKFNVSNDTIFSCSITILIILLIVTGLVCYSQGYKQGRSDEKIEWLEEQEIIRMRGGVQDEGQRKEFKQRQGISENKG